MNAGLVAACLALAASFPLAAADLQAAPDRVWHTQTIDGVRAGYAWQDAEHGDAATVEHAASHLVVRQLGHRSLLERNVTLTRNAAGVAVSMRFESLVGTVHVGWQATVVGTRLHIEPLPGHRGESRDIAIPDDARIGPLSPSEDYAALWHDGKATLRTRTFDPDSQRFVEREATRLAADPSRPQLVHLRVAWHSEQGTRIEDLWFDATGQLQELKTRALGGDLMWTPCPTDCDAAVAEPIDPMDRLVVRSPVWIPVSDTHRTLRYVVARDDGRPLLRATSEQAVAFSQGYAVVTICKDCGEPEPASEADIARFLAANAWVRSDDAEIRHTSVGIVSPVASVDWRMRKLADFVTRRMRGTIDFLGYADATTALHTGSGDCTEFAVLLAALARAQGIPTRVAIGVAYSDHFSGRSNVFSPHTWVQAWDGHTWKSYDAALNGFDATHIAFAVGDGTPGELDAAFAQLGHLKIEKAAVVRPSLPAAKSR